jgi:hypothetical protein
MDRQKSHDLCEFMRQISAEMSSEYNRIQMRATEDPGTAGDQGEENWAELLRDWLPRSCEVVTKGRLINQYGQTSPQIDVLVLNGVYPRKLLTKKMYLAAGVAAAFECKTTLKASHIEEAVATCRKIKSLFPDRHGSPYRELNAPLVYGLLAHSHAWKNPESKPTENIMEQLTSADCKYASHPRLQLDLLCVADLACWSLMKLTYFGPRQSADWSKMAPFYGPHGSTVTCFQGHSGQYDPEGAQEHTAIGGLLSYLVLKMAWENSSLRSLADYYLITDIAGTGSGRMRLWPSTIFSEQIRPRIEAGQFAPANAWDEWSCVFL